MLGTFKRWLSSPTAIHPTDADPLGRLAGAAAHRHEWRTETPLVAWTRYRNGKPADTFSIGNSFEGLFVSGRSGSGKTSTTGRMAFCAAAKAGYGILCTTTKPTDADEIRAWAAQMGRAADLVLVAPEKGEFNFLSYQATQGSDTRQLVELLMTLAQAASRNGRAEADDIWAKAMREWLLNALDTLRLAGKSLTMEALAIFAKHAPLSRSAAQGAEWQSRSPLAALLRQAVERATRGELTASQEKDLEVCSHYWLEELPSMADRTRSSIEMTTNATLAPFARGWMRDRFCGGSELTPDLLGEGKIVVLDYNVKEHQESGQLAQLAWKLVVQRWAERRMKAAAQAGLQPEQVRPLMLFSDECQFFLTREDVQFQTTARGSRTAAVYLTQNLPNVIKELGDPHQAHSLLGNLATKIFHCNDEKSTNEWAAQTIGQSLQQRRSFSSSGTSQWSAGASEQRDYDVPPNAFLSLRTGGHENGLLCEAVVFRSGARWTNGQHFLTATLPQT